MLCEHPAAEAALIGICGDLLGEEVAVVVTLPPGARADAHELRQFVCQGVAPYEYPRETKSGVFSRPRLRRGCDDPGAAVVRAAMPDSIDLLRARSTAGGGQPLVGNTAAVTARGPTRSNSPRAAPSCCTAGASWRLAKRTRHCAGDSARSSPRAAVHPTRSVKPSSTLSPPLAAEDSWALLLARTRSLDATHVATWDLPRAPAAVASTRSLATGQLNQWGLEHLAFTTELIVSELVTNAIRYGTPPIRVRLIRDRTLICEVSDASSTSPHIRRAATFDEGGRGLFIVAQCSHRWGTRYDAGGKTIWAEQPLTDITPGDG
ncbi:ATP-binding protein [Streptomyces sp. NPDC048720]|uniref:ATP-binding protein n=1 Tax=Streptomyces sp. NPDC048720 TaxID=3365588 RepID=UPI003716E1ED